MLIERSNGRDKERQHCVKKQRKKLSDSNNKIHIQC